MVKLVMIIYGDFFLSQPRYGLTSNAGKPAIILVGNW